MPAGAPAILPEVTSGFSQVLQENVEIIPRLGHDRFLQNLFCSHRSCIFLLFYTTQDITKSEDKFWARLPHTHMSISTCVRKHLEVSYS
jgi:hypothetical protein